MPSIQEIIIDAFGLGGVVVKEFKFDKEPRPVEIIELPHQETPVSNARMDTGGAVAPVNWLGETIFCDLILGEGAEQIQLFGVLLDVAMKKNIDVVRCQGLDGTIKTHINKGDYDIDIKGFVDSEIPDNFPIDASKRLIKLLDKDTEIKVVSDYLRLFDVTNLAIQDYNFFQTEGVQNLHFFQIKCLSDKAVELFKDV